MKEAFLLLKEVAKTVAVYAYGSATQTVNLNLTISRQPGAKPKLFSGIGEADDVLFGEATLEISKRISLSAANRTIDFDQIFETIYRDYHRIQSVVDTQLFLQVYLYVKQPSGGLTTVVVLDLKMTGERIMTAFFPATHRNN